MARGLVRQRRRFGYTMRTVVITEAGRKALGATGASPALTIEQAMGFTPLPASNA